MFAASIAILLIGGTSSLDAGTTAVTEFRIEEALALLETARSEGPYVHADHVRLYEQLGIALAYAGRTEEAIAAFDRMLALAPTHALKYTLSPKATLVFEQARERARRRPAPTVDVGLPRDRSVSDPLPIDVDVLADPFSFIVEARVRYRQTDTDRAPADRVREPNEWRVHRLALTDPSRRHRVILPAIAAEATASATIEVHVVVLDARRNEVLLIGTSDEPREILLRYDPPEPWYQKWWLWTAAGAIVVAGATTAVVFATRSEDPFIDGTVRVGR